MLRTAMGYLAAADPTALSAQAQAECLHTLEQLDAVVHCRPGPGSWPPSPPGTAMPPTRTTAPPPG